VNIAVRPSKCRASACMGHYRDADQLLEKADKLKASVRAKVDPPSRLIKQHFGEAQVRCRRFKKNA